MRLPIQSSQAVLIKPLGGDEEPWFRSVIVDFTADKELVILLPKETDQLNDSAEGLGAEPPEGAPEPQASDDSLDDDEMLSGTELLFSRGTKLEVEISFPDGIRRFGSEVRKLDLTFGGSIRIDWPDEGTRIQRRDYVRVEAAYRAVTRFEDPESGSLRKIVGTTMDLSAGGVRLQLAEPLQEDLRIEVDVDAGPLKSRTVQGRVVRSGAIEKKKSKSGEATDYWVAVEFLGVDEGLRKDLTQLVFDIQRQLMRRSLT